MRSMFVFSLLIPFINSSHSGSASCTLRYKKEKFSTISNIEWNFIDSLTKINGACSIDWSASSALSCSNTMVPISTRPVVKFYTNQRRYGLSVSLKSFKLVNSYFSSFLSLYFQCLLHALSCSMSFLLQQFFIWYILSQTHLF